MGVTLVKVSPYKDYIDVTMVVFRWQFQTHIRLPAEKKGINRGIRSWKRRLSG
jgi:hypothetical protein